MNQGNHEEGTVVGANVKLQGTLSDNNDIIIHGIVEGEVISEKNINITPSAQVAGPVRGKIVTVAGSVNGDVKGEEKTELLPTGKINGSITTTELIIQSGAIFNGKCEMSGEKEPLAKAAPQPKKDKEDKAEEKDKEEKESTAKNDLLTTEAKADDLGLDDFELE